MHQLQPLLERIGLNHHESTLYIHLLQRGELAASVLARHARIPRSTVRGVLDALCTRGIVTKIYKRNTQYYHCKPPESLVDVLEKQVVTQQKYVQEMRDALPLLNALFEQKSIAPKVQFYEGVDQVIEAFNSTLHAEGVEEILVLTSYEFLEHPRVQSNDADFYAPLRVRKGIPMRVIVGNTDHEDKKIREEPHMLRERRLLPEQYNFPGTFYIFGDAVLYFSARDDEYIALIVESAFMTETMRVLHTCLWEQCAA